MEDTGLQLLPTPELARDGPYGPTQELTGLRALALTAWELLGMQGPQIPPT